MENLFENAKFGDRYLMRDGGTAIFLRKRKSEYLHEERAVLVTDMDGEIHVSTKNGMAYPSLNCEDERDIVSKIEPTETEMPHDGITAAGMIEELKKYPSDALVVVEYCNPTKMTYDAAANIIKID